MALWETITNHVHCLDAMPGSSDLSYLLRLSATYKRLCESWVSPTNYNMATPIPLKSPSLGLVLVSCADAPTTLMFFQFQCASLKRYPSRRGPGQGVTGVWRGGHHGDKATAVF